MNIKIKEIMLQSFRAYNEQQRFDFTNNKGGIANLVVIFAPNGFGKTSLLDAVEWSLTKEINRFSKNDVIKKVAKLEKGIILKNRNSTDSNGSVKLTDQNGKSLIIRTDVRGRKYQSDYNEGMEIECSSEFKLVRESAAAKDNILSHDKIESFLLFSSGEERYNALAKFWDYANDTQSYKTIYLLWNQVKKEIGNKNKDLKKLSKDIKNIYFPINDINNYIEKINSFKMEKIFMENASQNLSERELTFLVEKAITLKSLLVTQMRDLEKNLLIIDQLFASFKEYIQKSNLKIDLDKNIKEIESDINKFDIKEKLTKHLKEKDEAILGVEKKLKMFNTLKEKGEYFNKTYDSILKFRQKIIQNEQTVIELKNLNHQISSNILAIEVDNEKNKKTLENYVHENETIVHRANQFKKNEENYKKIGKRIIRLRKVIQKRNERVQVLNDVILELEYLLKLDFGTLLNYKFENPNYVEKISSLKQINSSLNTIKEKRKKKKQEYEQLGRLNNDLNNVIKIGREIIQASQTTECPLCSTPHSNFEALLSRVDRNIGDVFKLNLIDKEIKVLEKDIKIQEVTFGDLVNSLRENIRDELNFTREKNIKESQKLQRINLLIQKTEKNESITKELYEKLSSYFLRFTTQFNRDSFDNDLNSILDNNVKKLEEKKAIIISAEKQLNQLNEQLNKNKTLILSYEKNNTENEDQIRSLTLKPDYNQVLNILETLGMSNEREDILKNEKYLINQHINFKEERIEILQRIDKIEIDLLNKDLHVLDSTLKINRDEKQNCIEFITNYFTRYSNYFQTNEVNENKFQQEVKNLKKQLELNKSLMSYFDILHEKLQYSSTVFESSNKIKEKSEITKQLKRLDEVQFHLNESLQKSQKLILEKITKAFNLEAINKIYSKIEPHPDLKFMGISPSFIGEKPSLEIYSPMGEERRDNPVLFFSSAQLDILSLSIFLAKALMEENPLLNSIFMDDPVHHMDSINVLSFIDLLRTLTEDLDRQIVITTHNENLYKLIQQKINPIYCNSKFIQLDSHGKLAEV